jgi:hypothetical protein
LGSYQLTVVHSIVTASFLNHHMDAGFSLQSLQGPGKLVYRLHFSQAFWIQFVHTISILRANRLFYYRIPIVLCIAERYIYEYTTRRMRRLTGVSIYSYPYLNILGARLDQPEIGSPSSREPK